MTEVAGRDKVRWGIMGTGWIASQFARDLEHAGNAVKAAEVHGQREVRRSLQLNMVLHALTARMMRCCKILR